MMKYAAIALLLTVTPTFAAGPPLPPTQQQSPSEKLVQHMTNSFTAWNIANNNLAEDLQAFATAYHNLEGENAQLKDELAKAKAPPSTAPSSAGGAGSAPMSTPAPKP